jgi:hypothetical protein
VKLFCQVLWILKTKKPSQNQHRASKLLGKYRNAPKGVSLVWEESPKLMIKKSGKIFLIPSQHSLIDLAGGEKIMNSTLTEDILSHMNLLSIIGKVSHAKEAQKMDNGFNQKAIDILNKNRKERALYY